MVTALNYIERIKRLYNIIKRGHTGNKSVIAKSMHVTPRSITNYMNELRSMGAIIQYNKQYNSYYFENDFELEALIEIKLRPIISHI